jgi:hypothetical protein
MPAGPTLAVATWLPVKAGGTVLAVLAGIATWPLDGARVDPVGTVPDVQIAGTGDQACFTWVADCWQVGDIGDRFAEGEADSGGAILASFSVAAGLPRKSGVAGSASFAIAPRVALGAA